LRACLCGGRRGNEDGGKNNSRTVTVHWKRPDRLSR
jgi:hypothetical protein